MGHYFEMRVKNSKADRSVEIREMPHGVFGVALRSHAPGPDTGWKTRYVKTLDMAHDIAEEFMRSGEFAALTPEAR
jgi:hypothetical protein